MLVFSSRVASRAKGQDLQHTVAQQNASYRVICIFNEKKRTKKTSYEAEKCDHIVIRSVISVDIRLSAYWCFPS